MVRGLHVFAELVEGFVVVGFAQVGQLVHGDHAQEGFGRVFEEAANADFVARLGFAAMVFAAAHVDTQRLVDQLKLAVINHLGQGRCIAHVLGLEFGDITVQCLVGAQLVRLRVALQQPVAQLARLQQACSLLLQCGRIGLQIGQ